jgi:aminopeptidase N
MREKLVCRFCTLSSTSIFSQHIANREAKRGPFVIHGAQPRYAPDRPFKLEHIYLELNVDPIEKNLKARATQRVVVVAPGQKWLRLDQIDLQIQEVKINGENTEFHKNVYFFT